jgi:hypothetical protein
MTGVNCAPYEEDPLGDDMGDVETDDLSQEALLDPVTPVPCDRVKIYTRITTLQYVGCRRKTAAGVWIIDGTMTEASCSCQKSSLGTRRSAY